MAKVELKQPIVDEIKGIIEGAQSVVAVRYLGINVDQDTKLRKELRENGVIYKVFKNTLIKRAIAGTEFAGLEADLEGPTAIAVSKTDATAPARIVAKYVKTVAPLELKGGIVEGAYYDAKQMEAISAIPGREELLSRLLGSLQSPIANFARVINQVAEQKGGPAPAAEEAPAAE
jgi:large subunit ribosomal protein L10